MDKRTIELICEIAKLSEVLEENINGVNGKPHSFLVNTIIGYLHHHALDLANVDSIERAKLLGLNTYLDPNGSRLYVEVPKKEPSELTGEATEFMHSLQLNDDFQIKVVEQAVLLAKLAGENLASAKHVYKAYMNLIRSGA